jgi:hypothetical protein
VRAKEQLGAEAYAVMLTCTGIMAGFSQRCDGVAPTPNNYVAARMPVQAPRVP